ncbi:reverse transcriptase domain-containing protein, partial [Tanacetum coccineum]
QDSLNSVVGGNFLTKNTQEALTIIENKSKVQTSRNKPQVASASGSSAQDAHISSLTKQVEALLTLHRPVDSIQNGVNYNQAQSNVPSFEEMMNQHMKMTETRMQQMQEYNNLQLQQLKNHNTNMLNKMDQMQKVLMERPQGVLPTNTIPNPREDLKAITTRSSVTLAGPSVPPPPISSSKEPSPTSTELPPAPVSSLVIPEPNPHQPSIPYPLRLNKEKLQGKVDIQKHSFLQIFKKIHFNISFAEALAHIPKFAKMVKDLLTNKEKLLEMGNTPLNENCLAARESCMALADLGASINLMPIFVWKTLSLPGLSTTRMTLELATRTVAYPAGIAEGVFVQVGKFTFPADFVVVDYEVDPRVPLILGRPFLRTAHALVDVHVKKLTLGSVNERLEQLLNEDPTPNLPPIPLPVCLINETEKIKSSIDDPPDLELKDLPPHIEYLEGTSKLPVIIAKDLKREEKEQLLKMLERLAGNEFYCFLDGFSGYFQFPIDPKDQDKTTFTCPYGNLLINECLLVFGIVLCHKISKSGIEVDRAKVDVILKLPSPTTVKGIGSFLGHADFYRRFKKDFSKIARPMTHLLEKDTPFFFSSECQYSFEILKKKLTEAPILVSPDWDLPFELMCDASDYVVGAVLGQRKDKYFRPIHYASKTLSDAQINYTVTKKELLAVVYAFENFWSYLVLSKTIVYTDHSTLKYLFNKQDAKSRLLRWILLLQEYTIKIHDKKEAENLAANHLSRLKNPYQGDRVGIEINDNFPHESLNMISLNLDNEPPWFADIANYLVGNVLIKGMSS